jgi:hypothetical protein
MLFPDALQFELQTCHTYDSRTGTVLNRDNISIETYISLAYLICLSLTHY